MPVLAVLVPLFPLAVAAVTAAVGWRRSTAWLAPLAAAAVTSVDV